MEKLSAHERSQILVATRQFDAAMQVWEEAFADPDILPSQLDLGGYLLDYLTIGLRVQRDPARVRKTLVRLAARPDMPMYLGRHVQSWLRALDATAGDLERKDRLSRARALVNGRGLPEAPPLGREQVVYDLVASSLLLEMLDGKQASDAERAEAYYLLGVVESRSVDSYWVPQAEFHLEAAIRLDPGGPFAEDAYAVLEEHILIGWGGASANELPADQWARLRDLRGLIDEAATEAETEGDSGP
jgi:hypothetical protein